MECENSLGKKIQKEKTSERGKKRENKRSDK